MGGDLFTHVCSGERVAGRHGVLCPRERDIARRAQTLRSPRPDHKVNVQNYQNDVGVQDVTLYSHVAHGR